MIDETLKKRLISSAFFIGITVATIFLSPYWFFFIIAQGFNLFALFEYLTLVEKKNLPAHKPVCLIFGALIPFAMLYGAEMFVLTAAAVVIFVLNFGKEKRDQAFQSSLLSLFGLLYISVFFNYLIKIRQLDFGPALVFYTLLLVKAGDAGAYFVGKKYGRVKLIEHISPNKSVEGAVGGFATTVILSLVSKIFLPEISFGHLFFLGIIISVVSQLGDLIESLIKRDVGIKDSGQVPGLGGILDVLDSLIFTMPFVYFYLVFLVKL